MQIRTKWHRLKELLEAGVVYFTAAENGSAPYHDEIPCNIQRLAHLITLCDKLPKFVVDPELVQLAQQDVYLESMVDMKRAGVLRLPYPTMVIEVPHPTNPGKHVIVILRDRQATEPSPWNEQGAPEENTEIEKMPFYGMAFSIERDQESDYLVVPYSVSYVGLSKTDKLMVGMSATGGSWMGTSRRTPAQKMEQEVIINSRVRQLMRKECGVVARAMFAAVLLMMTEGVKKEVIETERLNKARTASGKPAIPRHTYIRIGHVYRSAKGDETEVYVPGKSPRPHWRRGHNRRVRHGPKKAEFYWKYFYPRLVALPKDAFVEDPDYPDYRVVN